MFGNGARCLFLVKIASSIGFPPSQEFEVLHPFVLLFVLKFISKHSEGLSVERKSWPTERVK